MRKNAIQSIGLLEISREANENDKGIWSQLVKEVFRTISLHLHDSNEWTQKSLLGKKKKKYLVAIISNIPLNFRIFVTIGQT